MSDKNKIGRVTDLSQVPSIKAFLTRNNMKMTGMRRASKKVMENGYEKEVYTVRFKEGMYATVVGPTFLFEDDERDKIIEDLKTTELPQIVPFTDAKMGANAPKAIKNTSTDPRSWKNIDWSKDDVLCPLFNERGEMVMIEQRFRDENGDKQCFRWSYHDDNKWRHNDPEVLPFWGMDQLKDGPDTVYLHEGPKAAAAGRRFYQYEVLGHAERKEIQKHPWFPVLSRYPHLGWIGGGNRHDRSNWKRLKAMGVTRVIIFPDNDDAGSKAAYEIAGHLTGCDVFTLPDYPEGTPFGWDLADGCSLLGDGWQGMVRNLRDITPHWKWVNTPTKADPGKRKPTRLPDQPKGIVYIRDADAFTYIDKPKKIIKKSAIGHHFGQHLHPDLIKDHDKHVAAMKGATYDGLGFRPESGKTFFKDGEQKLNQWRPTKVKPIKMDAEGRKIWDQYFERLVPDPVERKIMKRWIATTIAHPARKYFGLLVHSDTQGSGKSLLVDYVLKPIIGEEYCAEPSPDDLGSRFTDWREAMVLIYADEITGTRFLTTGDIYQILKRFITAPKARIEKKGVPVYTVDDHAKILANSNKEVPLYLEPTDRRWMVVRTVEKTADNADVDRFLKWLEGDGLGMVLDWANNIETDESLRLSEAQILGIGSDCRIAGDPSYIPDRCNAPSTISKDEMLERTIPLVPSELLDVLNWINENAKEKDGKDNLRGIVIPTEIVENEVKSRIKPKDNHDWGKLKKTLYKYLKGSGWYWVEANRYGKNGKPAFKQGKVERWKYGEDGQVIKRDKGKTDCFTEKVKRTTFLLNEAAVRTLIDSEQYSSVVDTTDNYRVILRGNDLNDLIREANQSRMLRLKELL